MSQSVALLILNQVQNQDFVDLFVVLIWREKSVCILFTEEDIFTDILCELLHYKPGAEEQTKIINKW